MGTATTQFGRIAARQAHLTNQGDTTSLKYLKGGLWRSFMARYPEVNHMHKKALWVSNRVHKMARGKARKEALNHLWAAQCNCGYWHGLFGGSYLFHIRGANYRNLIAAEMATVESKLEVLLTDLHAMASQTSSSTITSSG